jgi:hypothetical protein
MTELIDEQPLVRFGLLAPVISCNATIAISALPSSSRIGAAWASRVMNAPVRPAVEHLVVDHRVRQTRSPVKRIGSTPERTPIDINPP